MSTQDNQTSEETPTGNPESADRLAQVDRKFLRSSIEMLVLLPSIGTVVLLVGALSWAVKLSNAGLPWRITIESLSVRMLVGEGLIAISVPLLLLGAICLAILAIDLSSNSVDQLEREKAGRLGRASKRVWKYLSRHFLFLGAKADRAFEKLRHTRLIRVLALILVVLVVLFTPITLLLGGTFFGLAAAIVCLKAKSTDWTDARQSIPWTMLCAYLFLAAIGIGILSANFIPVKIPIGRETPGANASLPSSFGVLSTSSAKTTLIYPCGRSKPPLLRTAETDQIELTTESCRMEDRFGINLWDWISDSFE